MKLFFATTNAAKLTSVARVLGTYGIDIERVDLDLPELQAESVIEVAKGKVRSAFGTLTAPVMVNDAGFCIHALGGFPGTNVKWTTKQIGVQGYLDLLARYPEPRSCAMVSAVAYLDQGLDEPQVFFREEPGSVALAARGTVNEHKSALATIFVPDGSKKTLVEMTPEEFAAYRAQPVMERYLHDFGKWLQVRHS